MKTLQNNFTTPEQSRRLLELGVPADSADCYFFTDGNKYNGVQRPFFLFPRTYKYVEDFNAAYEDKIFPCWSVGRLIEIAWICLGWFTFTLRIKRVFSSCVLNGVPFVEAVVNEFDNKFDFSKLEE